jgi:Sec-independent protein secretion pathway component TatC
MTLETVPLILLYVASIVLLKWVERRSRKRSLAEAREAEDDSALV